MWSVHKISIEADTENSQPTNTLIITGDRKSTTIQIDGEERILQVATRDLIQLGRKLELEEELEWGDM